MSTRKISSPQDSPCSTVKNKNQKRIPAEWVGELELLRRIINGGEVVNKPDRTLFAVKEFPLEDLRIATVSTNVSEKDFTPIEKLGYKIYVMTDSRTRQRLRKEFLTLLERAANAGAKLVCFNELAYPTPIDRAEDAAFRERVMEIVSDHQLFLVAGSYHDKKRFYNICPVFSPVSKPEEDVHGPVIVQHAKLTSAVKVDEIIRIPSKRNFRYYETEAGSFGILICLDAYDPGLVLRLMKMNYAFGSEDKVEVVFVPSFSKEKAPSLAKKCKDLSYATASLVVFVNCNLNEPRHAVYLAGEELSRGSKNTPVSTYRRRKLSKQLVVHEISYDWYHASRIDRTDSYNPVFKYLMGQKPGLRKDFNL